MDASGSNAPRPDAPRADIAEDVRGFAAACANGDPVARRAFLERYAEDVYNFPTKIYGVSAEHAGDFYLYAFERDRIFTRLRSFEGRNAIQFRTYLAYYVLRGLFLDWQKGRRELDTISLDAPQAGAGGARGGSSRGTTLADRIPAATTVEPEADAADPADRATIQALWAGLAPEERLDLKLLSLLEHDLDADDLRLLARLSRRSLAETIAVVSEVQAQLREKDVRVGDLTASLDSTWGWLVLRRRELEDVERRIAALGEATNDAARRLRERRDALEASIARRAQQRERILDQIHGLKLTTPYKDIARLKGSTVGTVCSRIFRLRERLAARWPGAESAPERPASEDRR